MNSSRIFEIERFAQALVKGAAMGLYLTPKPGLVDLADCGSHPDLNLAKMERSLHIVADYLAELIRSLADGERFHCQAAIGRRAEEAMFDELGTNTHKGYIFLSGLLLISRWHADCDDESLLRSAVQSTAHQYFSTLGEDATNGRWSRHRYGAGGVMSEAVAGLPSLFACGVPTYLDTIERTGCFTSASFATLSRLMQTVEDTTTFHRGGTMGLARIRRGGQTLERIIEDGGDHLCYLRELNRKYTRINLTMGDVADMLSLTYGYLVATGLLTGETERPRRSKPHPISRCASGR
ncbi:2-(5''-triphosphoribosyl)-3'-dephosphocoenzyme-A synthase [Geobacteraceae bacterium]|nr:2-(5''-triphosphoribosyl)-3'-dephosphocoenzyme-A synthase [Geobacteraceae bacterium]